MQHTRRAFGNRYVGHAILRVRGIIIGRENPRKVECDIAARGNVYKDNDSPSL